MYDLLRLKNNIFIANQLSFDLKYDLCQGFEDDDKR